LVAACALLFAVAARADERKPLDHDAYDLWNAIGFSTLSADGHWLSYSLRSGKGETTVVVRDLQSQTEHRIARGLLGRFTDDGSHFALLIAPDPAAVRKARADRVPDAQLPTTELGILNLKTGALRTVARARAFKMPQDSSQWLAYLLLPDPDSKAIATSPSPVKQVLANGAKGLEPASAAQPAKTPAASPPTAAPAAQPEAKGQASGSPAPGTSSKVGSRSPAAAASKTGSTGSRPARTKTPGTTLVLLSLETGMETRIPYVTEFEFSEPGNKLVYATSGPEARHDGVWVVDLTAPLAPRRIIEGAGTYRSLAIDKAGQRVAFCSDRSDFTSRSPLFSVYLWSGEAAQQPEVIAAKGTAGIAADWKIRESAPIRFSKSGQRLFFSTYPPSVAPESPPSAGESRPAAADEKPKARLDIWHWSEPVLQTVQQVQASRQQQRSYDVLYDIAAKTLLQLETEELPAVVISQEGDGEVALAVTNEPYRLYGTWESPGFADVWLIQLKNNRRRRILEKFQGAAQLSPDGKHLVWWDGRERHWFGMPTRGQKPLKLSEQIPHPLHNEEHDTPNVPSPYGAAGWTTGDRRFWVYDQFDIWQLDPSGKQPPVCITGGEGRKANTRYRREQLDTEERHIDPTQPQYVTLFCETDKATGYSQLTVKSGQGTLRPLLRLNEAVGRLQKARRASAVVFSRQDFRQSPDLWKSDLTFQQLARLTQANPQQKDYFWGTAELVKWKSSKGAELEGLLYKPENFDPRQKYPLLVYFYERNSDTLHRYIPPAPSASIINISFYVSRGYLVFVPDVTYETGAPGPSAMGCIVPGVKHLIGQGFVDEKHIGVQGHSWGGYQTAYLITQTDLFAAAEAGAPVSNMTSAYGGIRWDSGLSRMFQYERSQSRIGKNLWEARDAYIQNSPLFFADRIKTPLLILHNDKDGAVPWYQGIELFMALRRLERPCWLLNYNDEPHGVVKEENRRDFSIRMQQFFDHYLKGAPPAEWMVKGVPAVDKGKKLGLDLIRSEEKSDDGH
jgi:dipeptidyl aminopeptidase/acylaminoacyl peptidase